MTCFRCSGDCRDDSLGAREQRTPTSVCSALTETVLIKREIVRFLSALKTSLMK